MTFVAGNLCNVLDAIKALAHYNKDSVDCHLDALALAVQAPYQNLRPEQLPELSNGLRRVFEQLRKSTPDN